MKNLKLITILLLFTSALFASCGYQFEGGGYINSDVTHVAVEMMDNKSSETGADIKFTNALIKEIMEKTDTKITDTSKAIAILKGKINSITFATLSRSTSESVMERRVTANVDIQLFNKDGKIIWAVKNFSSNEDYKVSDDSITDESNKAEAVNKISIRMAEKIVSKMMNNF
jgi:outer membrane lipopolysaccharide assembly protein LptE/RlpB